MSPTATPSNAGIVRTASATPDHDAAVELGDRRWDPSAGLAPLRMEGTPTDFLRAVTVRRTRDHVEGAFLWDGDPMELLDGSFTQYVPYRAG